MLCFEVQLFKCTRPGLHHLQHVGCLQPASLFPAADMGILRSPKYVLKLSSCLKWAVKLVKKSVQKVLS
jgi:hypothetical protein